MSIITFDATLFELFGDGVLPCIGEEDGRTAKPILEPQFPMQETSPAPNSCPVPVPDTATAMATASALGAASGQQLIDANAGAAAKLESRRKKRAQQSQAARANVKKTKDELKKFALRLSGEASLSEANVLEEILAFVKRTYVEPQGV